jgi:hypothetical protein
MPKEETIQRQTRYRSEKFYPFRRCPKHDTELELCLNDTDFSKLFVQNRPLPNHHENRIEWRCDTCLIFWNENYFLRKDTPHYQIELPTAQLLLFCPICGSKRVTHSCTPACCTDHECVDCNAKFTAHIELVKTGNKKIVQEDETPLYSIYCPMSCLLKSAETTLTGILRTYRKCPDHQEEPLELAFVHAINNIPLKPIEPGWYCKLCKRVHFERGTYRIAHVSYFYEVHAAVECPACHTFEVNSISNSENGCTCECLTCGALLRVSLHPRE